MSATRYAWMMRRYAISQKEAEFAGVIHQQEPDSDGIYF
jgi:hypothetical protein